MSVPYLFSNAPGGTSIPLAELDANFEYMTTNPTLGNLTLTGNLTVGGTSTFNSMVSVNGGIKLAGGVTVNGQTAFPTGFTGTGLWVLNDGPQLIAPDLGTPASGILTNCTGLPIMTGVSGLGNGVADFLAVPSSLNLLNAMLDETGSGVLVFNNNPTIYDPDLIGNATISGNLSVSGNTKVNNLIIDGAISIDGQTVNPTGITGTGLLVLNTNPTINTPTINNAILVAPALGTPVSGILTNCTGLPLTTGVTGILPIANGGTGAATAPAALNNLLPSQATHVNQFLTTDGAGNVTWVTAARTVINIAALRALTPVQDEQISVGGYYADGDGGGGLFYGVTGGSYTDNGGTVITTGLGATGSSAWVRVLNNALTVKMFGAIGDGVADDTLRIQAAIDYVAAGRGNIPPSLTLGNGALSFPMGTYLVSSIVFWRHLKVYFDGGVLAPVDQATARDYLVRVFGYTDIHDMTINMNWGVNYRSAVYCTERYNDFVNVNIWAANLAYIFGDPAWVSPALANAGSSEIQIIGGTVNWGVSVAKIYGQETIIKFTGGNFYSYPSSIPVGNPNAAAWNALQPSCFFNYGGVIYIDNCTVGNFNANQQPCFVSLYQANSNVGYFNQYGAYFVSNTGIEAGQILLADSNAAYLPTQTETALISLVNCSGYQAGILGWRIDAGGDCLQYVSVQSCKFYGTTANRVCYALAAKVSIDPSSFQNITVDFYQTLACNYLYNYPGFICADENTSSQALSAAPTLFVPTTSGISDVYSTIPWYSAGTTTVRSPMRNAIINVSLVLSGGATTDITDIFLYINGIQWNITTEAIGKSPKATFYYPKLNIGDTIKVYISQYQNKPLDGTSANRLYITGNI